MGMAVLSPGVHTTIQDAGRPGYRAYGVTSGGAFDLKAYAFANAMVGNDPDANCAALELTLLGGVYEASSSLAVGLAGAPMRARIERADQSESVRIPSTFMLRRGDRLMLEGTPLGARTYLALAGGLRTARYLGCRSSERRLAAGEFLPSLASWIPGRSPGAAWLGIPPSSALPLRVVEGPDIATSSEAFNALIKNEYEVGPQCDRGGLRLVGAEVPIEIDPNRLSTPVAAGAIQIAGGQPILLGAGCGTMGGYPHVAQVISADITLLAQARPGSRIVFRRIDIADARRIDLEESALIRGRMRALAALSCDGLRFESAD